MVPAGTFSRHLNSAFDYIALTWNFMIGSALAILCGSPFMDHSWERKA